MHAGHVDLRSPSARSAGLLARAATKAPSARLAIQRLGQEAQGRSTASQHHGVAHRRQIGVDVDLDLDLALAICLTLARLPPAPTRAQDPIGRLGQAVAG